MSLGAPGAWKPVLAALFAAIAVSGLGALATDLGPWYYGLEQPAWQPPDWLFGPAWTLIYALTAIAAVRAWRHAPGARDRRLMLGGFAVNLGLNILWSILFFRLRRPDWALVEVVFLWFSILLLMVLIWPYARVASLLLTPYLAWVGFAALLNRAVVELNAPFAGVALS